MTVDETLRPESAEIPSTKQAWFVRAFTTFLTDLVVLNLFVEWWDKVSIDSFTVSIFVVLLLVVLLKLALRIEHRLAEYFKAKTWKGAKAMRWLSAWGVLFGSKFVILWAVQETFGEAAHFGGAFHGIITIIIVLVVMVVAEELVARLYRRLA